MKIPLAKPWIDKNDINNVVKCLESGWLIQGAFNEELEQRFAELTNVKHAVSCNSCTTALTLSLESVGIKEGDEVIVTPYSFIASANCIDQVGAKPVFVDIEKDTYNLDVNLIEKAITDKTKAVIAVHQYGLMVDMDPLMELAKKFNLKIIEDAACAHSAEYKGKKAGSIGDVGCFSFHPRKIITCGEAGMITTNNEEIFEYVQAMRNHGMVAKQSVWERHKSNSINLPEFKYRGHNFRLTDIQAAMAVSQLNKLEEILQKRREIAEYYNSHLDKDFYQTPAEPEDRKHIWQTYNLLVKDKDSRDDIIKYLQEKGISSQSGATLITKQPAYSEYKDLSFPNAEFVTERSLTIPLFPQMTKEEVEYVVEALNNYKK